jgi:hypothetical protein
MTEIVWANNELLDRLLVASDGTHVGMIDDLELSEPGDGGAPVITAFLCGPAALGARIGGRIGTWWCAVGARLRPSSDTYPNRIPLALLRDIDASCARLTVPAADLDTERLHRWLFHHLIDKIPGSR